MTDGQREKQVEKTNYEAPQITDYGTLAEFTAGMVHLSHQLDATFHNHDGPVVSIPS